MQDLLYNKSLPESVEIYLYYESRLAGPLGLETAIQGMLYSQCGQRDWIKDEELITTVEEKYIRTLVELPAFKKVMASDKDLRKKKAGLDQWRLNQGDLIYDQELENEEETRKYEELAATYDQKLRDLILKRLKQPAQEAGRSRHPSSLGG